MPEKVLHIWFSFLHTEHLHGSYRALQVQVAEREAVAGRIRSEGNTFMHEVFPCLIYRLSVFWSEVKIQGLYCHCCITSLVKLIIQNSFIVSSSDWPPFLLNLVWFLIDLAYNNYYSL
jgi:hypothetical protein